MSESGRDPVGVGFVGEGGHEFVLEQFGHPADIPECATQRPAPRASCRDEDKEMNLIGKI